MTQQDNEVAVSAFPGPGEAVSFGFGFFKANIWFIIVFGGLAVAAFAVASLMIDRAIPDTGSVSVGLIVVSLVLALAGALLRLTVIRRSLDYWAETNGDASPRGFADAVNTAVDGAAPRTLPYIGWALLWAVVFVAALVAGFAIADAISGVGAIVFLLVVVVVAAVFLILANFFLVAAVDRPGNPLSRSFHVFKGHVLRIVGTYLIYFLASFIIAVPIALVALLFGDSGAADTISNALAGLFGFVLGGIAVGGDAVMYRAVYPPA